MPSGRRMRSPERWSHSGRSRHSRTSRTTRSTIIAIRTIGMAALVTVTDALLAFPIAYYMARMASPRVRGMLVIAVLLPLWAAYLVKVYAWRTILQGNGFLEWAHPVRYRGAGPRRDHQRLARPVISVAAVHDPADLRRPGTIPSSLLEASSDLGGRPWMTFRPSFPLLVFPALVAGSTTALPHARRLHHT